MTERIVLVLAKPPARDPRQESAQSLSEIDLLGDVEPLRNTPGEDLSDRIELGDPA